MLGDAKGSQSVGRAVAQFGITGLAAVLLLGAGAVSVLRSTGRSEAIREAKQVTRLAGNAVVGPHVDAGVLAGRPGALRRLDAIVRRDVLSDPVVRVKLWSLSGRIVYSDERPLIGTTYTLGEDELDSARGGRVDAEVSDLSKPENRFERRYGKLLEVYKGIRVAGGRPLLFETYLRYSSVAASGRRLWLRFLPALIGALVLLELVQIPLAYLLARRLRERERERRVLLERALDASDLERRRIAASVHDGPVQSLAGVAFSLGAAGESVGRDPEGQRSTIRDAAARTRETIRDLRTMLVELHPPSLHRAGLAAAISDLLARAEAAGVDANCRIDGAEDLADETEEVLFRAAREAIQNVLKHAGASHVDVQVERHDGTAVLTVADDGAGFDPDAPPSGDGDGHLGLRLVAEAVAEAGGRLQVDSRRGEGTRVRVEVPAA
jgi:two-component system NarL family sensor kinase